MDLKDSNNSVSSMQRLGEVVELYLKMDTNYALMITGAWGTGKTHYYNDTLKRKICDTPVLNKQENNYKAVLVSLFGLKSIKAIQSEIFLSFYPLLKSSRFKLAANLGKSLIKGILAITGKDDYSKLIDETNVETGNLITLENIVICFDDLERISKDLNIEEVIGYINSLVESGNVKILIIANEEKINFKDYKILKEKVVGNTIEFIPNIEDSYDGILTNRFGGAMSYSEFLADNKTFVLDLFIKNSTNLRTLIFILKYYETIYAQITLYLFNDDNLKERKEEILLDIMRFSIAISIEYKEGNLTYRKRKQLDSEFAIDFRSFLEPNKSGNSSQKKEESKATYRETFILKYYPDTKFSFYKSVYDYITGGTPFEYSSLLIDVKKVYNISEGVILPQYEVYSKLGYQNCYTLNDKEYLMYTKDMLKYAYKGSYDIGQYLSIFAYAVRFNNPLDLDFNNLAKAIIKGMIKGEKNYKPQHQHMVEMYLDIPSDTENIKHLTILKEAILALNAKLLYRAERTEALQFEELFYKNFEEFYEKLTDRNQSFYDNAVFEHFNVNKFYSYLYNSSPSRRWELATFISRRYREYPSRALIPEVPFLKRLRDKIERRRKILSGKNVSSYVYEVISLRLQTVIDYFENIKE